MIMNLNQKAMIARAGNEAKMMGNDYIGSEHVLLALLRQGEAALARRLAAQGIYPLRHEGTEAGKPGSDPDRGCDAGGSR